MPLNEGPSREPQAASLRSPEPQMKREAREYLQQIRDVLEDGNSKQRKIEEAQGETRRGGFFA